MRPDTAPASEARTLGLLAVLLGAPIIWAVRFGTAYALVPFVCRADAILLLHASTLIALAAVAAVGLLAWRYHVAARAPQNHDSDTVRRTRFIALFGMLASLLFAVVIVAEAIGNVMIDPCTAWGPLVP